MLFILKLFILIALIKVLLISNAPFWCAGAYAVINLLFCMAQGFPMQTCLLMAGIAAVTATIYFWLLNRFEDQLIWWPIAIIGVLIVAAPTLLSFFVNYSYLR